MDLSVVIATWNEAANLPPLLAELRAALAPHGLEYEVIVVDGGSSDGTEEVARSLGCEAFRQTAPGFGGAVREGLARARGDFILTLDADLSHPPTFFAEMWQRREEADLVIASRYVLGGSADMPRLRAFLSRVLNRTFAEVLAIPLGDLSSGYRLYRRSAVRAFETRARDFNVLQELLTGIVARGGRVVEVPFHYRPRVHGSSHARIWKFGLSYLRSLWHLFFLRAPLFAGGAARRVAPYALVIGLAVLGAYVNALGNGFVRWDDDWLVFSGEADLFGAFDPTADRAAYGSQYTPLSDLSYAIDRRLFGETSARPYHIQGVAWHALAAVLLFLLVNRKTQAAGVAFGAALIFALHPAATDAVTWISGRRTVMAAAFMLGAALAWLRGARGMSVGLAVAANLSKQMAVVLPVVLFLLEGRARRGRDYAPHIAVAAAFAALHLVIGAREGIVAAHPLTPLERLEISAVAIARYASVALFPSGLRPHYALIHTPAERAALVGGGAVAAAALLAAAVIARRRAPLLALGAGGALATLLPALFGLGAQAVAERYMYLPLAFAAIAASAGFARLVRAGPPPADLALERALVLRRRAGAAALAIVLGALGVATHVRNRAWRDDLALWADAATKEPLSPIARAHHARALLDARRFDEAERELRAAAALFTRFGQPEKARALLVSADALATADRKPH